MAGGSDEELVSAAARGDREAFGALVERHHRAIIRFVSRFLGIADPNTAEDLAQDVFLRAWLAAPSFRPRPTARVSSWLLRIATNVGLNHLRHRRLRLALPIDEGTEPWAPEGHPGQTDGLVLAGETVRQVREAISNLAPMQRAAIVLREFHGLPYAEIAEVIETSVPAVESLLVRARRALGEALAGLETQAQPQVFEGLGVESS